MIAVIFEVWPKPDRKQEYLDIAADLKPLLEKIDGFISIERFESLYEPGKIVAVILSGRGSCKGMARHKRT
jgi:heme-degrading monooxygenase HmoA